MPRVWICRISWRPLRSGTPISISRSNRPGPVGGADDDDFAARVEAVHERQQLRDDAPLDLARDLLAAGRDAVELVDEDDAWRVLGGVLEDLAEVLFGLAVELADDLRSADVVEARAALVRDGLGEERLACSGRAVEEDALGCIDAEPLEDLGVAQRQLDHLADALDGIAHAAEVLVGHDGRGFGFCFARFARLLEHIRGLRVREDGTVVGFCADDLEREASAHDG